MWRRFAKPFFIFLLAAGLAVGAASAKDDGGGSWFSAFLESLLSTPDRQVKLTGLEGVFSANPKVEKITVADRDGVWLELDGVEVAWNRAALFDRTIDIESLKAARVAMLRRPVAAEAAHASSAPSPPPLAIKLNAISLPQILLSAPVAGGAAELTATGAASIAPDVLSVELSVDRQDRAGSLVANLRLEPQANVLTADIKFKEPAGGLVAELFGLRGRPSVAVTLSGTGPLDAWRGTTEVEAGGTRVLAGGMSVSRGDDGYHVAAEFAAALQTIVPEDYAMLLAGDSRLTVDLTRSDDGAIALRSATLRSEGVDLSASGMLGPDMVPRSADLSLKLGQAGRAALPFVPGDISVATLTADIGLDSGEAAPWKASIKADGVEGAFGRIDGVAFDASGQARDLARPSTRATNFRFAVSADGVVPNDLALRDALGPTFEARGTGSWSAGRPVAFEGLSVILTGATANFSGTADRSGLSGDFAASVIDLSRFSDLAGRALEGRAELKAKGSAGADGALDLKLGGTTTDLSLGIAMLDPLLAGATKLSGGLARNDQGFRFDNLVLVNERASAELNGSLSDPAIDMSVAASVADLSLVTERAEGTAKITAHVTGSRDAPKVEAEASGDNVVLMGRPLADASARFSGTVAGPATAGEAEISGTLGDAAVRGKAKLSAGANGARMLDDLRFAVGESQITGDLAIGADGLLAGKLNVVSPDLSKVAPLFLVEGSGALRADIALSADAGAQSATFSGTATDVVYGGTSLKSAAIEGQASDLFGVPKIEGDFSLANLTAGGLTIVSAKGTAERSGEATAFTVDAALADGRADLKGDLAPRDGGLAIGLQSLLYKRPGIDLALAEPTTIEVKDGVARFERTTLKAGGGTITLSGSAGPTLDLEAVLASVPAALVNAASPGLGAEGTISGVISARGAASSPDANFEITLAGASVAASRNAGLGPLGVSARGTLAKKRIELTSEIFGADGMSVQVTGTVGAESGGPLDLRVKGGIPLALGNRQLAARGAALNGALNVDVAVSGTTTAPKFSGRVTAEGGGFVDPETGIVLKNLSLVATVSGDRVVIERLNAESGEGTVSATGRVGLDPNAGFPIDLTLQIRKARYVNGTLVAARFDADLALTGTLAEGPLLKGKVTLDRTDITVPDKLPSDSVAVTVEHVDPPPKVEETLAVVRAPNAPDRSTASRSADISLDVAVSAPQRIFVRGRGLDAEFGGNLTLRGPISSLAATGAFRMVRGRLDILTQRIAFDRGVITFAGDLDPILDFSGSTRTSSITITVAVSGRASDPQVTFTSSPDLPQDEILARLIFSKGIGELSPLQIARLGAAASELSGGSGGILSQLRATTGLDDLDIVTDEKGQTSVAAGRYVTENVYVGVQQGTTTESSRVTIDLDVTKSVKARAGYSADGESSLGIFYEREY